MLRIAAWKPLLRQTAPWQWHLTVGAPSRRDGPDRGRKPLLRGSAAFANDGQGAVREPENGIVVLVDRRDRRLRAPQLLDQRPLVGAIVERDVKIVDEESVVALRCGDGGGEARVAGDVVVLDQRQVHPGERRQLHPQPRAA